MPAYCRYVNPVPAVAEHGTYLSVAPNDYVAARRAAGNDLLVVVLDNLLYKQALVVPDATEWADRYQRYAGGHYVSFTAYRVSEDALLAAGATIA